MMKYKKAPLLVFLLLAVGCTEAPDPTPAPEPATVLQQSASDLLAGEVMAMAYSGFREGQHPDRGEGAVNPSYEEPLEDLEILLAHDFKVEVVNLRIIFLFLRFLLQMNPDLRLIIKGQCVCRNALQTILSLIFSLNEACN